MSPTMIGTEMPAMLPPRFMQPPSKPARSRPARIEGTAQYMPHQRRKNRVVDSSAITTTGSVTYATEKIETVAITAATPNKVRNTVFGPAPLARHLSPIDIGCDTSESFDTINPVRKKATNDRKGWRRIDCRHLPRSDQAYNHLMTSDHVRKKHYTIKLPVSDHEALDLPGRTHQYALEAPLKGA